MGSGVVAMRKQFRRVKLFKNVNLEDRMRRRRKRRMRRRRRRRR